MLTKAGTSVVGSATDDGLISAISTAESVSLAHARIEHVTTVDDLVAIDALRHLKASKAQKPVESAMSILDLGGHPGTALGPEF